MAGSMRIKRTIVWTAVVAGFVTTLYVGWYVYFLDAVVLPNAYSQDWVSAMIIDYMKAHDDAWPRGWDDLRDPYEEPAKAQNYPWSFEELQSRVAVDWKARPEILRKMKPEDGRPPFCVIWLRDGRNDYYEGDDPNLRILRYLTGRSE